MLDVTVCRSAFFILVLITCAKIQVKNRYGSSYRPGKWIFYPLVNQNRIYQGCQLSRNLQMVCKKNK